MRHIIFISMIVVGGAVMSFSANADDAYFGFDISQAKLDLHHVSGSPLMARSRFGIVLLPDMPSKFGFETHLAMGTSKDSTMRNVGSTSENVKLEMESIVGLYMRAEFLTAGIMGMYGLVGISAAQTGPALVALNDDGTPVLESPTDPNSKVVYNNDSTSDYSIGVGMTFFINKYITLQVEVLQVQSADNARDFDLATMNFGVNIPI